MGSAFTILLFILILPLSITLIIVGKLLLKPRPKKATPIRRLIGILLSIIGVLFISPVVYFALIFTISLLFHAEKR